MPQKNPSINLLETTIIDLTECSSEEEEEDDEPLQMGYRPLIGTHSGGTQSAASAAPKKQLAYEVDPNYLSRRIQVGDNLYFWDYEIGYIEKQIERIERWRSPAEYGPAYIFVYYLSDYGGRKLNTFTDSRRFHKSGTHNNVWLHEYKVVGTWFDVHQIYVPRSLD